MKFRGLTLAGGKIGPVKPNTGPVVDPLAGELSVVGTKLGFYDQAGEYHISADLDPPLYDFITHTFSTGGATSENGPTQAALRTAYASAAWAQQDAYFTSTNGKQLWTVPATGWYKVVCVGGRVSGTDDTKFVANGQVEAEVYLRRGDKVTILVGQYGGTTVAGAGASYLAFGAQPLLVAGGTGGIHRNGGYAQQGNLVSVPNPSVAGATVRVDADPGGIACGGAGWDQQTATTSITATNGTVTPRVASALVGSAIGGQAATKLRTTPTNPATSNVALSVNGGFGGGGGGQSFVQGTNQAIFLYGGGGGYHGGAAYSSTATTTTPTDPKGGRSGDSYIHDSVDLRNKSFIAKSALLSQVTITKL